MNAPHARMANTATEVRRVARVAKEESTTMLTGTMVMMVVVEETRGLLFWRKSLRKKVLKC